MTQDEIIKALRKVVEENTHYTTWTVSTPHLVLLVNLAIEKEREACARVCDSLEEQCEKLLVPDEKWPTPSDCANIIRARGQA
jgi:hypothetical protein